MSKRIYHKFERDLAKAQAETQMTEGYIEALEAIALAAYDFWKLPLLLKPDARAKADALYDALAVVNFMDEDE